MNETIEKQETKPFAFVVVVPWVCLFLVFLGFCVFWATIDNIDVDGSLKVEFRPYELWIGFICYVGLISLPFGTLCGLWCLLTKQKHAETVWCPTILLGLLSILLFCHQMSFYLSDYHWRIHPPTVVPASPEINETHP